MVVADGGYLYFSYRKFTFTRSHHDVQTTFLSFPPRDHQPALLFIFQFSCEIIQYITITQPLTNKQTR